MRHDDNYNTVLVFSCILVVAYFVGMFYINNMVGGI